MLGWGLLTPDWTIRELGCCGGLFGQAAAPVTELGVVSQMLPRLSFTTTPRSQYHEPVFTRMKLRPRERLNACLRSQLACSAARF